MHVMLDVCFLRDGMHWDAPVSLSCQLLAETVLPNFRKHICFRTLGRGARQASKVLFKSLAKSRWMVTMKAGKAGKKMPMPRASGII